MLQARSLTVPGAPYSYTVGAGAHLDVALPNPGTYDLSLHGPNGFFRRFAGSLATQLRVVARTDHAEGRLRLLILQEPGRRDRWPERPLAVDVVDAYGDRRRVVLRPEGAEIVVGTDRSGGWYDITLTTPADPSFSHQLAGRLESARQLTSDPQLGGW